MSEFILPLPCSYITTAHSVFLSKSPINLSFAFLICAVMYATSSCALMYSVLIFSIHLNSIYHRNIIASGLSSEHCAAFLGVHVSPPYTLLFILPILEYPELVSPQQDIIILPGSGSTNQAHDGLNKISLTPTNVTKCVLISAHPIKVFHVDDVVGGRV